MPGTPAPPPVSSRRHALVSRCRALAAGRGPADELLLDGSHLVADAAAAGLLLQLVVVAQDRAEAAEVRRVTEALSPDRLVFVTAQVFDALSPVRTPSGILAIAHRPRRGLRDVFAGTAPLVVIGVDVQDPGNVGALVRAAEAGGATGAVFAGASADPWGWKALRGAMGSAFRLPLVRVSAVPVAVGAAREAGLTLAAAVPAGGVPMDRADLASPLALLLGGEGAGLPAEAVAAADLRVSVPMAAHVESLNVAVAGALLVYEARRQRAAAAARG